jgi:lipopolysaccharide export system protein LptA
MITVIGDQLIGSVENGEMIRKVIGNVILTQGNVLITCDSATQYLASNNAKLQGNVIITQDTLTITTDEGFYYGNERRAYSDKGVKLNDKKVILTAKVGEYFFNQDEAYFRKDVKLYDTSSTLTSYKLYYYRFEDKAVAVGYVKIVDNLNFIYADSLVHFRKSLETYGFNNVLIKSLENNSFIFGDYLEDFRGKKYSFITKYPLLMQIDTTFAFTSDSSKKSDESFYTRKDSILSIDTLLIKAEVMEAFNDSTDKFIASNTVEIIRGDFSAANDHTIYYRKLGKIVSSKDSSEAKPPVIWYNTSQMSGDSLTVILNGRQIDKVYLNENSLITSHNEFYPSRYDQITGRNVILFFNESELQKTDVYENVLSIYFMYDLEKPNGLVKASSRDAKISFSEDKVSEVRLYGDPVSEYHPENLIKGKEKDFLLPRFVLYSNYPVKNKLLARINCKIEE